MSHPFSLLNSLKIPCRGVLQIGANVGQEIDAISKSGAELAVLVEPLPMPFKTLAQKTQMTENMIAVQTLCTNKTGEVVDFHVASNNGQSSSVLEPAEHRALYPGISFESSLQLRTITVDDMLAHLGQTYTADFSRINVMMMDVQGAEHLVLQGSERTLSQLDAVFCEVSLGGLYADDMAFEDFQIFMRNNDFRICWARLNRKGWGDALFLRSRLYELTGRR